MPTFCPGKDAHRSIFNSVDSVIHLHTCSLWADGESHTMWLELLAYAIFCGKSIDLPLTGCLVMSFVIFP